MELEDSLPRPPEPATYSYP